MKKEIDNCTSALPVNIYQYLCYREFLRDYYQCKKNQNPSFSYRAFARKAELADQSLYIEVVKNKRKLSDNAIKKFTKGLGLEKNEKNYFELLVRYNQCSDEDDKGLYYRKLLKIKLKNHPDENILCKKAYYEKWYLPVIREIISEKGFDGNFKSVAKKIYPPLKVEQVKQAIKELIKMGILTQDYKADPKLKLTPTPILKKTVNDLQKVLIEQSKNAIDDFPSENRHISSMMLPLDHQEYEKVVEYIDDLRNICGNFSYEKKGSSPKIYQLNIQFFPRTTEPI